MRLRKLGALALAVLTVAGLSSCTSKVGQAAVVDGHRLSDATLSTYVRAGAKSYPDTNNNGATVTPKLYALENWVDDQLFERTIESKGGSVTSAELGETRGLVLGTGSVADVEKYYTKLGYTNRFAALFLHEQQMVVLLVKRLEPKLADTQILQGLQSGQFGTALLAAVKKRGAAVSVSARYGAWSSTNFSLTQTPGAGLPAFVTFNSVATSAASSTG